MDNIFQVPLAGDVGPKTKNDSLVMRPPLSVVWPCLRARMGRDPFELVVCVASS
jgi:hypothetical protein